MSNKNIETLENKKSWSGKTKIYLLVLVVGAGLIAGDLYYKNNKDSGTTAENDGNVSEVKNEDKKDETATNYLEGVLSNSDNLNLGNLKLVSSEGEIYLRTSRDFSKLVGLQVMVFIDGTKEKFELKDIQSKVSGDSYLLPQ